MIDYERFEWPQSDGGYAYGVDYSGKRIGYVLCLGGSWFARTSMEAGPVAGPFEHRVFATDSLTYAPGAPAWSFAGRALTEFKLDPDGEQPTMKYTQDQHEDNVSRLVTAAGLILGFFLGVLLDDYDYLIGATGWWAYTLYKVQRGYRERG